MMPNTAFDDAMLDFTKPGSRASFLQGMMDQGVSGWMADFDEGLPLDVRLILTEATALAPNLTECYFQVTLYSFDGILWSGKVLIVFSGYDDLSML
jgi:alpha-glucosidase (family GH31 glycosyl hydrolase)